VKQLFAGKMYFCTDSTVVTREQCVGMFVDLTGAVSLRVWQNPVWGSFDNLAIALYSLFPVIACTGWELQMYSAMDIGERKIVCHCVCVLCLS
jgi:hypothetical protein